MFSMLQKLLIFALLSICANAGPLEIHTHPELAIVDYKGPIDKNIVQLLRGAEILEIRNSELTKMEGNAFSLLPNLRVIKFHNCTVELSEVDLERLFEGAVNLRVFHASHTKIPEMRSETLRRTHIEEFQMTDHNFPKFPGNTFNETNLKKMILHRNHFEEFDDAAFNGLDKLELLDLKTNKVKTIRPVVLEPVKSLRTLKLRENLIEKFGTENLPQLPKLEYLDIAYNPLKELNLDKIETVAPKLTNIDITGTQLSDADIKALKEKHPSITFTN